MFFDAASQEVPLEGGNAGTPSRLCYFSKALSWSVTAWGLRPRNEHGKQTRSLTLRSLELYLGRWCKLTQADKRKLTEHCQELQPLPNVRGRPKLSQPNCSSTEALTSSTPTTPQGLTFSPWSLTATTQTHIYPSAMSCHDVCPSHPASGSGPAGGHWAIMASLSSLSTLQRLGKWLVVCRFLVSPFPRLLAFTSLVVMESILVFFFFFVFLW